MWYEVWLYLLFFAYGYPVVLANLLKRLSVFIELVPLLKISCPFICGPISRLSSVLLIYLTFLMPIPHDLVAL